jgi:hypothetical protein
MENPDDERLRLFPNPVVATVRIAGLAEGLAVFVITLASGKQVRRLKLGGTDEL